MRFSGRQIKTARRLAALLALCILAATGCERENGTLALAWAWR